VSGVADIGAGSFLGGGAGARGAAGGRYRISVQPRRSEINEDFAELKRP
jgi:hypothetical protein